MKAPTPASRSDSERSVHVLRRSGLAAALAAGLASRGAASSGAAPPPPSRSRTLAGFHSQSPAAPKDGCKVEDEEGNPKLETAELIRVYGKLELPQDGRTAEEGGKSQQTAPARTPDAQHETELLRLKPSHAEQERDSERERRQDAEAEKDRLLGIIEKQTLLLQPPVPATETSASNQNEPAQRGFWDWLKGK